MTAGVFINQGSQRDMKMTPSLNPSPQGRETPSSSFLGGAGLGEGYFRDNYKKLSLKIVILRLNRVIQSVFNINTKVIRKCYRRTVASVLILIAYLKDLFEFLFHGLSQMKRVKSCKQIREFFLNLGFDIW